MVGCTFSVLPSGQISCESLSQRQIFQCVAFAKHNFTVKTFQRSVSFQQQLLAICHIQDIYAFSRLS